MADCRKEYRGVEKELDEITAFLTFSPEDIAAFPVLEEGSTVRCAYTT